MSAMFIIVTTLKVTVSLTAVWTILFWHFSTKGSWRQWPAGRSLMSLLAIIFIGYAWRVVNRMVPDYALEEPLLGLLYIFFSISLIRIARTIRKELAAGKSETTVHPHDHNTGIIAVVAATTPEEKPDAKP